MNRADTIYQRLVSLVLHEGERVKTRNSPAFRVFDTDIIRFRETPLITVRKTAWRKALREMEWFLSGDSKCPEELLDWWDEQLNPEGHYLCGYGEQLKLFGWDNWENKDCDSFNQIEYLIDGLKNHPYSRRHVITTWNPADMSRITQINSNPKTPSCCHATLLQYFVSKGKLYCTHYQRSADILLGAPHNFIQHWALLLWLASQADLEVGGINWLFGDLHLYNEPSHIEVAKAIIEADLIDRLPCPVLFYNGNVGDEFKADNFVMIGHIDSPVTTVRPKLL